MLTDAEMGPLHLQATSHLAFLLLHKSICPLLCSKNWKWGAEGTSRRSHHDALLSLQCPPPSLFLMFFLRPPLRSASKSHTKAHTPAPVALHVIFYNVLRGWVFQNFLNITKECLLICFCHQSLEKHHPCRDFIKIHFPRSAILEMR